MLYYKVQCTADFYSESFYEWSRLVHSLFQNSTHSRHVKVTKNVKFDLRSTAVIHLLHIYINISMLLII